MGRVRRAGLYVRISDDREGAGLGVERQEEDCRKLAESLGWRVVGVYSDNDISAYSGKRRPDYERLLEDVKSEHIDAIIAWHADRLHRSPKELESFIDTVEKHHVEIHTVKGGHVNLSTPEGRLMARQLGLIARYESEHKSDRIKRKIEQLIRDGKIHNGGVRPFGFDRHYSGEGPRRKILGDTVNPEEAALIRVWAKRALEGEGLYSIMGSINDAGILTSTGRPWSQQALRLMLISGRIAGLKEHHGEVIGKAEWDPIITMEEHRALRALLTKPERFTGGLRGARKFAFTGMVVCDCRLGQLDDEDNQLPLIKMKPAKSSDAKKYPIFQCKSKKAGGCGGRSIKMAELEDHVVDLLCAVLEEIEAGDGGSEDEEQRKALEDKLLGYEARKEALREEYAEGEHSPKEFRQTLAVIDQKMDKVTGELAGLGVKTRLDLTASELRQRWDDPDFPLARRRATIMAYIEEIRIAPATRPYSVFNPSRIDIQWR